MRYKRPESILVVIYTSQGEVLVLNRKDVPGYWQSVTGSLEEGESPKEAAVREVFEETAIKVDDNLIDCNTQNLFTIPPAWKHRYAPDVIYNTEFVFTLRLPQREEVTINKEEHSAYLWLTKPEAINRISSSTNREAVEQFINTA